MSTNTYIDLFAGAGGLSEGFIRAGFIPVAHVEQNRYACSTLRTRLVYHYLRQAGSLATYISYLKKETTLDELYASVPEALINTVINERISKKTLPQVFAAIDTLLNGKTLDVIAGGPPCQAYSITGRVAHSRRTRWDSRKFLYKQYGEFLVKYKPRLFLFENVPGLYSAGGGKYYNQMLRLFDELGYETEDHILDSAYFDVVQRRRRVIIIGWKKGLPFRYPQFTHTTDKWTVADILSDLPPLRPGQAMQVAKYVSPATEYLLKSGIRNGMPFTTQHIARPHNERDRAIYRMAIAKWRLEGKGLKNNEIPQGIRTQKNVTSFLDRFKVVRSDDLSHTMIAHIAKDGHHFIHPDAGQLRSISVREAARIQSFPDDYFFEGPKTSAFTQIGNAVPPLMAEAIACAIRRWLTSI